METKRQTRYTITSGRRTVAVLSAWSPAEALLEYVRGLGCRHDEIHRTRSDAISWRGATFTATPATDD
ncbi:MAG: hypothetical protein OEW31_10295 [Thermoleophilia bacterium]|nr:hypothetical protein [Thermoleophilia bacterium]